MNCCKKTQASQEAKIPPRSVARLYDSIAPAYNAWGRLTESKARNRAIELARIIGNEAILEVAVGTGLAFQEIVKRNPRGVNIGIDISPGMLAKARERLGKSGASNYTLRIGSAYSPGVEPEWADILFNNYMFDLIPFEDMDPILEEFRKALKKNGRLIMVNMTRGEKFGSSIYESIYKINPRIMGGCRGVTLSEKLKEHGFIVETREYYQQMFFPSEVILATKK